MSANWSQVTHLRAEKRRFLRVGAGECESLQRPGLEMKGIEQSALKGSRAPISQKGGAKCGAFQSENDPDLQLIIDRWLALPGHIRAAIKALVQTAEGIQ